jgi:hypothetical protein
MPGSGKSMLMKQIAFMHGRQLSTKERSEYIPFIWKQILSGVQTVYKKRHVIEFEKQETTVFYPWNCF